MGSRLTSHPARPGVNGARSTGRRIGTPGNTACSLGLYGERMHRTSTPLATVSGAAREKTRTGNGAGAARVRSLGAREEPARGGATATNASGGSALAWVRTFFGALTSPRKDETLCGAHWHGFSVRSSGDCP